MCCFRRAVLSLLDLRASGETTLRMRMVEIGEREEGEDDDQVWVQILCMCISLINLKWIIFFFFSTPLEHARELK